MATPRYTFDSIHQMPDFWALSDRQLAAACVRIAEAVLPSSQSHLRAEAARLFLLWRESMDAKCPTLECSEQRASTRAALRKRTIQVLVRISLEPPPADRLPPSVP